MKKDVFAKIIALVFSLLGAVACCVAFLNFFGFETLLVYTVILLKGFLIAGVAICFLICCGIAYGSIRSLFSKKDNNEQDE